MTDLQTYPHPSVSIDLAILTIADGRLKVLLVDRAETEVPGHAMPGGFVRVADSFEQTIDRILTQKVGVQGLHLEQLATYGALNRDPRGRVISIVYLALCPPEVLEGHPLATLTVPWEGEAGGPAEAMRDARTLTLAFDHADILGDVVKRLRGKLNYSAIAFAFLPPRFTLREVQEVHEAILGKPLTKPPFRRKLLDRGRIAPTGVFETGGAYRPAELYKLKPEE